MHLHVGIKSSCMASVGQCWLREDWPRLETHPSMSPMLQIYPDVTFTPLARTNFCKTAPCHIYIYIYIYILYIYIPESVL